MLKYFILVLIGFVIGKIQSYYASRKQCFNCGKYTTYLAAAGYGGGKGKYQFAVKHWEGYYCTSCNKTMSVQIELSK